jgi:hypothetical protein
MRLSDAARQSVTPACGWSAEHDRLIHRRDGLVATLDPHVPAVGLVVGVEAARDAVPADHLLGLDLGAACRAADQWLRATDLTAVYEPADARRLRATAMWRLHPAAGPVAVWELIVSAQTSLLQSDPGLAVVADVAGDELLWSGGLRPGGSAAARGWSATAGAVPSDDTSSILVRRKAIANRAASSFLIAVHPADAHRITVERHGGRIRVACRLFSDAIEKGVLLRGRVLAAVGPAAGDTAWADKVSGGFAVSPPPLTT